MATYVACGRVERILRQLEVGKCGTENWIFPILIISDSHAEESFRDRCRSDTRLEELNTETG